MKLIKSLTVIAIAVALMSGPAFAAEGKKSCCEKAKAEGKDCAHQCCVDAKKDGKVCEKCNKKKEKKEEAK
jgi:hypothetical protein